MKLILNHLQIKQKIKRLAYEIYENHFEQETLYVVGIEPMGLALAELLQKELEAISPLQVHLLGLSLDKKSPLQNEIRLSKPIDLLENQNVILVDDVLNSGKTMFYALRPFFEVPLKKLQTLVLINRNYKNYPINPDYVGYALATTLQEHISVVLEENWAVYIS